MTGKYALAAVLTWVVAAGTGCMMSPLEGDYVGSISAPVSFNGATPTPGELVRIQARRPSTGTWHTIRNVYTGSSAVGGYGTDWYLFGASVAIPNRYWQYQPGPGYNMTAEVRAIAASGPSGGLVTFNQAFAEYFDPAETEYSLNDLLSNAGNGPTVTVTGTYAAP